MLGATAVASIVQRGAAAVATATAVAAAVAASVVQSHEGIINPRSLVLLLCLRCRQQVTASSGCGSTAAHQRAKLRVADGAVAILVRGRQQLPCVVRNAHAPQLGAQLRHAYVAVAVGVYGTERSLPLCRDVGAQSDTLLHMLHGHGCSPRAEFGDGMEWADSRHIRHAAPMQPSE